MRKQEELLVFKLNDRLEDYEQWWKERLMLTTNESVICNKLSGELSNEIAVKFAHRDLTPFLSSKQIVALFHYWDIF